MKLWQGGILLSVGLGGLFVFLNSGPMNQVWNRDRLNPGGRTVAGYLSALEHESLEYVHFLEVVFLGATAVQEVNLPRDWKIVSSEFKENAYYLVKVEGKNTAGLQQTYLFKVQHVPSADKLQIVDSCYYLKLPPAPNTDKRWDLERFIELRGVRRAN
ncbi:MAG: hypothetical protein H6581_31720 [Bacteroidia bacterium]|nr:hypothetical protein [Bacteroidia bacterium]